MKLLNYKNENFYTAKIKMKDSVQKELIFVRDNIWKLNSWVYVSFEPHHVQ